MPLESVNECTYEFQMVMMELEKIHLSLSTISNKQEEDEDVYCPHEMHYISQDLHKLGNALSNEGYLEESQLLKSHSRKIRSVAYDYQVMEEDMHTSKRLINDLNEFSAHLHDEHLLNMFKAVLQKYEPKLF